jgi:hypothetical protein
MTQSPASRGISWLCESDQANRRTFDQDNRWFVVEAAGGLNCCVLA